MGYKASWHPLAFDAEHALGRDGGGLFLAQLAAPGGTLGGGGTLATVVELQVAGGLLVGSVAPVVPSGGNDVLA